MTRNKNTMFKLDEVFFLYKRSILHTKKVQKILKYVSSDKYTNFSKIFMTVRFYS